MNFTGKTAYRSVQLLLWATMTLTGITAQAMNTALDQFCHATNEHRMHAQKVTYDINLINARYPFRFAKELTFGPIQAFNGSATMKLHPLLYNGKVIGGIKYRDSNTSRHIYNLDIYDAQHRGKGRGGWYLEQFMKKARDEGMTEITLCALPERVNFYHRLGFLKPYSNSFSMIKILSHTKPTTNTKINTQKSNLNALQNCRKPGLAQALDKYDIDLQQEIIYENHIQYRPTNGSLEEFHELVQHEQSIEKGYYDVYQKTNGI